MDSQSLELTAGALIVFEGLDRTGKSTQVHALSALASASPPAVAHMPSGLTPLTQEIYAVTEGAEISSAWARQLLHLACHAETRDAIVDAQRRQGLLLDRWWWSTVAYGWYGAGLQNEIPKTVFDGLIDSVWAGVRPDLVLLFLDPHEGDRANRATVTDGYRALVRDTDLDVVQLPRAGQEDVTRRIVAELTSRGLARAGAEGAASLGTR